MKSVKTRNYYEEISARVRRLERGLCGYGAESEEGAVCQRIDWAWRFRKITEAQKDELADRMRAYFEACRA